MATREPGQTSFLQAPQRESAFSDLGLGGAVEALLDEIRALYLADSTPWVVGYSGGKDSTATTQLIWMALRSLPPEKRHKPVHIISTDTLVENPIVAMWADASLAAMRAAVDAQGLWLDPGASHAPYRPAIRVHRLTPALEDSFWVCLIGRGYPAPREKFRWCTERLKIKPSNAFINNVIAASGETILVLGTRKAESTGRAARMTALEAGRVRDRLSPNKGLPGSLVYSPIEDWSNDDVWMFLMQYRNPWEWSNRSLLALYRGASEGGECPIVIDTSTPSCGASRFGCWVCTLVEQDKSMTAMVQNDEEKAWMLPLLELRNALDFRLHDDRDRNLRDYRRMSGKVQLMMTGQGPRVIPGPYLQSARADWLRRLLAAERYVREHGPEEVRRLRLVTVDELHEIRRIWVEEKHELEDLLPRIYEEETGERFPAHELGVPGIAPEDLALLREAAGGDEHLYHLTRDLLAVEHRHRQTGHRSGLYRGLEGVLERYAYASEDEAIAAHRASLSSVLGNQLELAVGEPIEVAAADPAEKRERVMAALDRVARAGGMLGELAAHVRADLKRRFGEGR